MSILIRGMEMPKEGSWRSIRIYPDGTIGRPIGFGDYALVEGAKAIPAPPHGRLGDFDALIEVYERQIERHKEQAEKAAMKGAGYTNDMYIIDRNRDIIRALKAAPTIIPAGTSEEE